MESPLTVLDQHWLMHFSLSMVVMLTLMMRKIGQMFYKVNISRNEPKIIFIPVPTVELEFLSYCSKF